ncbi:hypothetical protein BCR44DRAFT_1198080 [Catenaria anguillulae PL171]|uniref:Uncharacterized protein n=1 Tax=Catenaria anguillulae PL171 TaxID=765915 RepID=A0A1Y2HFV5_9FUNG|nr:hypothetical protein BCR44DRAFT_1198080 [Catenaria anguillulae PL171]
MIDVQEAIHPWSRQEALLTWATKQQLMRMRFEHRKHQVNVPIANPYIHDTTSEHTLIACRRQVSIIGLSHRHFQKAITSRMSCASRCLCRSQQPLLELNPDLASKLSVGNTSPYQEHARNVASPAFCPAACAVKAVDIPQVHEHHTPCVLMLHAIEHMFAH